MNLFWNLACAELAVVRIINGLQNGGIEPCRYSLDVFQPRKTDHSQGLIDTGVPTDVI
jgi:hypothetical protein